MGLFRGHKEHPKEPSASPKSGITSPRIPDRRVSSSHLQNLGNLFSDANGDDKGNSIHADHPEQDFVSAPTIDMDEFNGKDVVKVTDFAQVTPTGTKTHFEDDNRKLSAGLSSTAQRASDMRRSKSRQEHILQRAGSISLMGNRDRDSIKRSVSRKIARSESRLQCLMSKDSRDAGTSSGGVTPVTLSPRGCSQNTITSCGNGIGRLSLSRTSSEIKRHFDDLRGVNDSNAQQGEVPKIEDFDQAYGEDDDFLVEEATQNDFTVVAAERENALNSPAGNSSDANAVNVAADEVLPKPNAVPEKAGDLSAPKRKMSKRPPPLLDADCGISSGDPASAGPITSIFGHDGGFATGGFKITSDGMVAKPSKVTREDSDPQIDGEVPQSDRNLVVVRCLKEFKAGLTIGSGAAGRVYLAEHVPSKRTMALKVVNVYDKEKRNQLLKELETLSTYVSRYLVRFHGAFYDGSGAVHMALEYMDHGCLATFVQRVGAIPEKVVQMITMDCLRGLRFLHRNHVLHRDFKTANILLSRRQCCAKLSDFGLARDLNPGVSRVETFVGTVAYMSPERLEGSKYTYASDVWALGVSMMECLLGRYPFDRPQNYFDYIDATLTANMWSLCDARGIQISSQARDFITQCTHAEPTKRPQASSLLEHPWLVGVKKDAEMFGSWLDHCRIKSIQVAAKSRHAAGR